MLFEAFQVVLVSLVTLIAVAVFAVAALRREQHPVAAAVAICLGVTPFFFSGWIMHVGAGMRHIVLES